MKWLEKHWILAIVVVLAVVYLYQTYGAAYLNASNQQSQS